VCKEMKQRQRQFEYPNLKTTQDGRGRGQPQARQAKVDLSSVASLHVFRECTPVTNRTKFSI
jgi:hypothetical protein